jgi:septum formation protein
VLECFLKENSTELMSGETALGPLRKRNDARVAPMGVIGDGTRVASKPGIFMNPFIPSFVQRHLVLASKSPRRIALLKGLDIPFKIEPADISVENHAVTEDPQELPVKLAELKAQNVAVRFPERIVIGADTVVIIDGEVLEKPADDLRAREHLQKLSGRSHEVITGLAVVREKDRWVRIAKEVTRVHFKELSDSDIENYVASGEGSDKAGGYAIQGLGSCLITSIDGCYYNVVGLPISLLVEMLNSIREAER